MALPDLEVDDPRELQRLEEPDELGAVTYVISYFDAAGGLVHKGEQAVTYVADGYDKAGIRVAGLHGELGVVDTEPSAP